LFGGQIKRDILEQKAECDVTQQCFPILSGYGFERFFTGAEYVDAPAFESEDLQQQVPGLGVGGSRFGGPTKRGFRLARVVEREQAPTESEPIPSAGRILVAEASIQRQRFRPSPLLLGTLGLFTA
jgi:hypothetical protein